MIRIFFLSMVFLGACLANADENSKLGEILYSLDLPGEWKVVVGENDSFMLSKNGRFSIASMNGKFQITDLWNEQGITAKELKERFDLYPVEIIKRKSKAVPIRLGKNDIPAVFSIFLILGDSNSINFFKESESYLTEAGADVYVLPGKDFKKFYGFECSSFEKRVAILRGVDVMTEYSSCDEAVINGKGASVIAMTKLLSLERAPFAIVNTSQKGAVVSSKTIKALIPNE